MGKRGEQRLEVGGLSYESMIATVKILPDLIDNIQKEFSSQFTRMETLFSERAARLEAKIDIMKSDGATKTEVARMEQDINQGFEKGRERFSNLDTSITSINHKLEFAAEHKDDTKERLAKIEAKIQALEITDAKGEGRFTWLEKIGGLVVALLTAAAFAFFKL